MLKPNRVKERLQQGRVCLGTMLRIMNDPQAIALSAAAGWDFVILDTEHCGFDFQTLSQASLVSKYEPLCTMVRVPDKQYHQMARALDLGAEGLVLPRVDTVEQVEGIIKATKYYPMGERGASISSIATRFRSCTATEYLHWSNQHNLNVIQIESEEAVERAPELVAPKGIDAVLIGPFDLSQNLGIPGQVDHPRILDAYRKVIRACRRHGKAPGVHLQTVEKAKEWIAEGMRLLTIQYDSLIFQQGSRRLLEGIRGQKN